MAWLFGFMLLSLAAGLIAACMKHTQSPPANQPARRAPAPRRQPQTINKPQFKPAKDSLMNIPGPVAPKVFRPQPTVDARHLLDARKTVHAFDFILKSYGLPLPWSQTHPAEDYVHDLTVMMRNDDLRFAALEISDRKRIVVFRHVFFI